MQPKNNILTQQKFNKIMYIKKIFPVSDMMCAVCANSVETALKQAKGVKYASVNYATQKATIEFNDKETSPEMLKKIVIDAGYDLQIDFISSEEIQAEKEKRLSLLQKKFWGSLLCALPVFVISMFHLEFPYHEYLQGFLTTLSLFWFGKRFFVGAWKQLQHLSANMDTLVAISTGTAYVYSWSSVLLKNFWIERGIEPHLYFESAVVIISFILLGKLLEERAKGQTSSAIKKLMGLKPTSVWAKRDSGWEEINIEAIEKGDILLVKSGQKIAVDGQVTQGESYVDESMITGEPLAVKKFVGEKVFSGTINQLGSFQMIAQKIGTETLLSQVIKAVEEAQGSKASIEKLTDKISRIFVPIVIGIALISFILWNILDSENGFSHGLQAFVTVLVIACPCALGLATPTAIMVGIGKGAENGILIKNTDCLEQLYRVDTIVLDKTGTITEGNPTVIDDFWLNKSTHLPILLGLESSSQHPLAQSITKYYRNNISVEITQFQTIVGQGVQALFQGKLYRVGNVCWARDLGVNFSSEIEEKIELWKNNSSVVVFFDETEILAILSISDAIKKTSKEAILQLKKSGIEVFMLTGDQEKSAEYIARQVGISSVKSEVKPSEKQQFIQNLQHNGKIVAMVGDGINDSQALAQANVSIAMGKGSDIAIDVAGLTIISSDLLKIPKAITLSQQTLKTIRQNLFWAFIYNIIGIPIASGILYAFGGFLLNPMIAGAAMAFSSVSVVTNSLLLKRKKI